MQNKDVERYLAITLKCLAIVRKYLAIAVRYYNLVHHKAEQVWFGTPDNNVTRGGALACAALLALALAAMITACLHPAPNHRAAAKKPNPAAAAKSTQNPERR